MDGIGDLNDAIWRDAIDRHLRIARKTWNDFKPEDEDQRKKEA